MRSLIAAAAISLSFVLVPASAEEQGQLAPVQQDRTPPQADQSRDQERARGENVQIQRDWKAEQNADGAAIDREGAAKTEEDQQTVGRDWRAHPESGENR